MSSVSWGIIYQHKFTSFQHLPAFLYRILWSGLWGWWTLGYLSSCCPDSFVSGDWRLVQTLIREHRPSLEPLLACLALIGIFFLSENSVFSRWERGGRQLWWWRGGPGCCFTVTEFQSYPSPHLSSPQHQLRVYWPQYYQGPASPSLSPSLDSQQTSLLEVARGPVWPEGVGWHQNSRPRSLSAGWRRAVQWPRRGKCSQINNPKLAQ